MARMRAVDAAVLVLEKEGISCAFGVPGAAINPFYSALKARGSIRHILARHVEAASHMAEGFTRAAAGNIGLCIGTSGPAGTDMITGLYSAAADSIPILCITGQAPRARLNKEDFQAVDIAAIAAPVAKWAVTVMEPYLVPMALQKAFHLMRSSRPGPVLIDLPVDVQLAEIEFDIDAYEPLAAFKPEMTRGQAEKALAMLNAAKKPLIVAGGGIINADASDLLIEFAEITGVPVIPTLMGWGTIPDDHRLMAGMCGLQTSHLYGNATMLEADFVLRHRQPLGEPAHRLGRDLYEGQEDRPCRHRADADRPRLRAGSRHRLRCGRGAEDAARRRHRVEDGRKTRRLVGLGEGMCGAQEDHEAQDAFRPGAAEAAARLRGDEQGVRPRHDLRHHDRLEPDRRRAVPACLPSQELDQLRPGRPARLDAAGRAWGARRAAGGEYRRAVGRL